MDADPIRQLGDDLRHDPFMRDHVGLVMWGAGRVGNHNAERRADALKLAVTLARRGHDPKRGTFATYFSGACRWARIEAARQLRLDLLRGLNAYTLDATDEVLEAHDERSAESFRRVDAAESANRALKALKPRTREIVRRVIMYEETMQSVGRSFGISRERVRQILLRAMEDMREVFA